ncbi:MAG: protease inhibitor I42 family protein [Chloroflexota bacterium]|nr:protease inhibitor I42 family protein [Chloroflexota bacterium]
MKKLVGLTLILVLLTACAERAGAIDLDAANNGTTVQVANGQTITITLDSNITTGYKWNLVTEPNAQVLKLLSSEYVPSVASNLPVVGAGGKEVWKFQTTGRGTTSLKLAFFRPFDPSQVAKEFAVTFVVK